MHRFALRLRIFFAVSFGAVFCATASGCRQHIKREVRPALLSNESYIKGLYTTLKIDSPRAVFDYVYGLLPAEVTVYPSENIYYFKFPLLGKTYDGTLTLYTRNRDSGILGFGYVNRMEQRSVQKFYPVQGGSHDFSAADGLSLQKKDAHSYQSSYKGKTVLFHLYALPDTMPAKLQLAAGDEWVSSTFDESGLQFHLLFNRDAKRLFWVLNEQVFVPESFHPVSPNLVAGDRTEFVFYNDTLFHRKILVGAAGENVLQNNWYDGPFDHLPDNRVYAGRLEMKPYLEAHYPEYKGQLDRYGHFLQRPGRVALAPYRVYFSLREMRFIDSLKAKGVSGAAFLQQITAQVFQVPKGYYESGFSP
jgi:hypothetical protein